MYIFKFRIARELLDPPEILCWEVIAQTEEAAWRYYENSTGDYAHNCAHLVGSVEITGLDDSYITDIYQ